METHVKFMFFSSRILSHKGNACTKIRRLIHSYSVWPWLNHFPGHVHAKFRSTATHLSSSEGNCQSYQIKWLRMGKIVIWFLGMVHKHSWSQFADPILRLMMVKSPTSPTYRNSSASLTNILDMGFRNDKLRYLVFCWILDSTNTNVIILYKLCS